MPPDVKRLTFSYDVIGQMTRIDRSIGDDRDPAEVETWSDPVSSAFEYDAHGRLIYLGHSITSSLDDTTSVIESYNWTYDERHRLTVFASLTEGTTTYGYDELNQLTSVDRAGTTNDEEYAYDDNGNRISSSSAAFTSSTYETELSNRLVSDGTFDYEYDAEGNRTKRTTIATGDYVEYQWDHRNRLTEVTFKNSSDVMTSRVEYAYDPFNHRIAKTVYDGSENVTLAERYLYDRNSIIADLNPDGTVATAYFVIGGTVYAQQRAGEEQPVLWLLQDQLGSTRQVVESDGDIVATYGYDSFGNILASSTNVATTNILWTGLRYDPETNLYMAMLRYYDPIIGRWLSVDFIEDNLNNPYGYVRNSSVNAVDPSGLAETNRSVQRFRGATRIESGDKWMLDRYHFVGEGWLTIPAHGDQPGVMMKLEYVEKWAWFWGNSDHHWRVTDLAIIVPPPPPPPQHVPLHAMPERLAPLNRNRIEWTAEDLRNLRDHYGKQQTELQTEIFSWCPVVGDIIGVVQAVTGRTLSGDKLDGADRVIECVAAALPIVPASAVKKVWNGIKKLGPVLKGAGDAIKSTWKAAGDKVNSAWNWVSGLFGKAPTKWSDKPPRMSTPGDPLTGELPLPPVNKSEESWFLDQLHRPKEPDTTGPGFDLEPWPSPGGGGSQSPNSPGSKSAPTIIIPGSP